MSWRKDLSVGLVVAAVSIGGSYFVAKYQIEDVRHEAQDDRLRSHETALDSFRISLEQLRNTFDDRRARGIHDRDPSEDVTAVLARLQPYASNVRDTAVGDLVDSAELGNCDAVLRRAAGAFLNMQANKPLSWNSISDPFVADS